MSSFMKKMKKGVAKAAHAGNYNSFIIIFDDETYFMLLLLNVTFWVIIIEIRLRILYIIFKILINSPFEIIN